MTSEPVLVELVDGRIVSSSADEWRTETMARHLLHLPLLERRAWLADHRAGHGDADTTRLMDAMTAVHESKRKT